MFLLQLNELSRQILQLNVFFALGEILKNNILKGSGVRALPLQDLEGQPAPRILLLAGLLCSGKWPREVALFCCFTSP